MQEALAKLITNIANLFKVKTIVTMAVIAAFAVLAVRGRISAENVMLVVTTVVAFYFGTVSERDK